jgi:6-pyruvoyl-tetrahydropterin synthase
MIAHSLRGEVFGPAPRLHGATYVIDAEFRRSGLNPHGIVVDIGLAGQTLRTILAAIDYRNLDDEPAFTGSNTTTEALARYVFDRLAEAITRGALGPDGEEIDSLRVTLRESHVASAAYEAPLAQVINADGP